MLVSIELIRDEVSKLANNEQFPKKYRKHFRDELFGFQSYAKARVKEMMRAGNYPSLGVWQYIKTGTRMFVNTGNFERSLAGQYYFSGRYITGMKFYFKGTTPSGFPHNKLARLLTEGATWTPTKGQRARLKMMARRSDAPKPEGAPKKKWRIPPRPFIKDTFGKPEVHMKIAKHGAKALVKTIRELKGA